MPGGRLPRGPHKAHGSPAAESHRCPAPGPCAQTQSPSRSPTPPAPKQGWQLQFKCLIKASPRGGGGRAEPAPRPRPGARGASGCAGQRAGGSARVRRRRRPGAPACAWSSGQTLFRPSVELRLVKRRRPPPPLPWLPRATDTRAGRPLKGNAAPFPRRSSVPGTPGASQARASRAAGPLEPRDVAPRAQCPPGAPPPDARAVPTASGGALTPARGNPASRALGGNPGGARWGGREQVQILRPRGLAPSLETPTAPSRRSSSV